MDEAEEDDRDPRVDEDRIQQHVEPGLPLRADLDQDDHRQDVLAEHDGRHELGRHEVVDIRVERREGELDVADDDEDRRDHQEVRLHEVDALIPHADVLVLPAGLEHLRDEAVADIELALCPAAALVPRLLERQRLLVVDDGVVCPARLDAFGHALHRELHVLCQAGRLPAVLLEDLRSKAHARAAEAGREADVRLREVRDVADDPERDGKRARDPRVVRILRVHVALDDLVALAEAVVHLHEELRVYEVVGIEDADGIVLLVHLEQAVEHPLERIALALLRRMRAHVDERTCLLGNLCRVVCAVVGDDVDVIHVLRIVELLEVLDELADDGVLVVCRDDKCKRLARRLDLDLFLAPHAAEADDEEIEREEEDQDLHWHHDDVKRMCEQKQSAFLCKTCQQRIDDAQDRVRREQSDSESR